MAKRKIKKKSEAKLTIPKRIFAQASPKSIGGVSMFNAVGTIDSKTVGNFQSEQQITNQAVDQLRQAGFEILQVTPYAINIAGNQKTYEQAFNTKIIAEERSVIKGGGVKDTATFIECPKTDIPGFIDTSGSTFADVLEGVAIEEPRYFMAASAFAPLKSYWHLRVPSGISLATNADKVHRGGITGKGIKIAMVDSGHYKHPFFIKRGYRVAPVVLGPAASNPLKDESGHGTGESANIFAVAPDVNLLPVKINYVNSVGAFNAAVALNPDIITCSWGSSRKNSISSSDQVLAAAVASAWASGITVIFAAGNGQWGFPGQHPDVISAGGVFMNMDESLQASNYASGFMSNIYSNRRVPDLCGLVGMKPKAIYIMLPVEPGDSIDSLPWNHISGRGLQGGTHPQGDETANNDGWAAFSGTSAAAPQLAGVAALIKQACSRLKPRDIRYIMMRTARDVTQGRCNHYTSHPPTPPGLGHPATSGPDLATGNGLVNAFKAVMLAKIRCLGIVRGPGRGISREPIRGREPIEPIRGRLPEPIRGREPIEPIRGRLPEPIGGREPIGPRRLADIELEEASLEREAQNAGLGTMTQEDIDALEGMVMSSDIDINDLE